jgi:hypothetical protein
MTGDLTVGGTVTAQEFHAEFVSSSIIYESGSTKFGDTMDDIHWRTGSMYITGSDHHFFGSVGMGTTDPNIVGSVTLTTGTQLHLKDTYSRLILDGTTASEIHMADLGYTADSRQFRIRAINDTLTIASATDNFGTITDTLTVDHAGNVGIGTTNPARKLSVYDSTSPVIQVVNSTTGATISDGGYMSMNSSDLFLGNQESGGLLKLFVDNDASKGIVIDGGNVGIGITNPAKKLDVDGGGIVSE